MSAVEEEEEEIGRTDTVIVSESPFERWCLDHGLGRIVYQSLLRCDFDEQSEIAVLSSADIDKLSEHLKLSFGKKAKLLKALAPLQRPKTPVASGAGPLAIGTTGSFDMPLARPGRARTSGAGGMAPSPMRRYVSHYGLGLGSLERGVSDGSAVVKTTGSTKTMSFDHSPPASEGVDAIMADTTVDDSEKVRLLAVENERLGQLLAISERALYTGGRATGSPDALSMDDIERIRRAFDSFDASGDGCVAHDDLNDVLRALGEVLTETELQNLIKQLDTAGTGTITFGSFLSWWQSAHRGGKKGKRYRARFKLDAALVRRFPEYLEASTSEESRDHFDLKRLVVKHVGRKGTAEYRVNFHYQQTSGKLQQISPWHDIPLFGQKKDTFNFICEVPKWTRAKFEIATGEPFNPIHQDMKHGKLRFYQWGDMMFNYGAFPQTWEDPKHSPEDTGMPGDNDPIDGIEIGTTQLPTGSVTAVKILGVLALLDSGETDWKVLCINSADPLSKILNDVHDVEKHIPGAIDAIREYLRIYKVCTGSAENQYALRGEAMNEDYAEKVIKETHEYWKDLMKTGTRTLE